eukprot:5653696-Prymnesium_polylepis.1
MAPQQREVDASETTKDEALARYGCSNTGSSGMRGGSSWQLCSGHCGPEEALAVALRCRQNNRGRPLRCTIALRRAAGSRAPRAAARLAPPGRSRRAAPAKVTF